MAKAVSPGLLPFGEYRPDVSDYEGAHSKDITNVVPQGDGYGPFQSFAAFTSALASLSRGMFYALKNDGTVAIFGATATKLYLLNNTNQSWTDVSKSGGSYSAVPSTDNWTFAQFNNFVFAVQLNAPVQVIDLTSPTAFADLGGSPPQAKYVAVVNQFLVLSGIAAPNVYRVQWSGLDATTTWTAGVTQSDFQDLADGGIVRGVAGGEFGVIFQDRAIRRMTYSPGSPYVFDIIRISSDDGLFAPYSIINAGERVFFLSPQGFKMLLPGLYPQAIGKEKVDRTFFNDVDTANLQLVIGAVDPRKTRAYWAYKSINGASGAFDKILSYDWALDRWSLLKVSGEYLCTMSQPGITLEGVDAAYANPSTSTAITSFTLSTGAGDTFTVAASPNAGQGINFTATTVPNAYTIGTPYYVKATGRTSTTFRVSASGGVGALEGVATTSTSSGSGTFAYYQPSEETVAVPSLDAIAVSAQAQLAAVNTANKMGFFTGSNLEATLESAQHGDGKQRIYVRKFRPITDAPGCFGSLAITENVQTTPTFTTEQQIDARGDVWQGKSTRYARGKLRIPAATNWTFAAGVEPDVSVEGQR